MLTRLATGAALAAVAAALTLWAPKWLFDAAVFFILLVALWEWNRFKPLRIVRLGAGALMIISALPLVRFAQEIPNAAMTFCYLAVIFWAYQGDKLFNYWRHVDPATRLYSCALALGQGWFVLMAAWSALFWMRMRHGELITLSMLAIICSADIFAYAAGRRFGKYKLAPTISPGKTIEGALAGIFAAVVVAVFIAVNFLQLSRAQLFFWGGAAFAAAVFSVIGDLHISRMKRQVKIKNTGRLLPGHGGVLDRIDGLLAAAPVFAVIWQWAG